MPSGVFDGVEFIEQAGCVKSDGARIFGRDGQLLATHAFDRGH
jgi:hypothetical protein